ncbi:hypothetical protein LCGC14_1092460 [marine sediment metagenome]|uniref:Terminase small subunit n=1 Tax=marine sediment metagenome TaxID=412755 RepID=A0A0F9MC05_9ZZZZ
MTDHSKPLKDGQRERYARNLAKGGTADHAAFKAAGFKGNRANAARCKKRPDMVARVAYLRGRAARRTGYDIEAATDELEDARKLAELGNNPAVMVSASMGKAKVNGLLVETHKHTGADGETLPVTFIMNVEK